MNTIVTIRLEPPLYLRKHIGVITAWRVVIPEGGMLTVEKYYRAEHEGVEHVLVDEIVKDGGIRLNGPFETRLIVTAWKEAVPEVIPTRITT